MGEIASILTSVCWVTSTIFFTEGGKRVGSMVVNRVRIVFGLLLLMGANFFLYQELIPLSASSDRWFWLGLSGFVGLALGDIVLFQSYLMIGPRRAMLLIAGVPVLNTVFAWFFLNEALTIYGYVGIAVTVAGIFLVLFEKTQHHDEFTKDPGTFRKGYLFASLGALGQSAGMILARKGVYGDFPSLSGTLIRVIIATSVFFLLALTSKKVKPTISAVQQDRKALGWIIAGSITGPFLGIWLALTGLKLTDVGIASTLQALAPVMMLPIGHFLYKEHISARAIIGTFVAMAGVAVIFILA
ncbi:MAG: DMT family transporter [Anaerolineae bacterium]|jgi:drug/metabolite transporter (DMT)-like permease|nr:DMT family transporter [Anaerolineae bacterium]